MGSLRSLALLLSVSAHGIVVLSSQIPLQASPPSSAPLATHFGNQAFVGSSNDGYDVHEFKRPIRKVAIIGAGPSGLIAYRELIAVEGRDGSSLEVHLFERDNMPGGNWHYTDEVPLEAPIPNVDVSVGDYVPSFPPKGVPYPYEEIYRIGKNKTEHSLRLREHRGPKPVWKSLKSNTPSPVQQIREWTWPKGTPWELPQERLQAYMRSYASYLGINVNDEQPNIHYNTRVELVEKHVDTRGQENGWKLIVKQLQRISKKKSKAIWREEFFDAVLVASGRYNAPNMPAIRGLKLWNDRFPQHIMHSRQYRIPQTFSNKTVLIVGGSVSAVEIARDIGPYAQNVYQSIRPDNSTLPHWEHNVVHRIPPSISIIPEIKELVPATNIQTGKVVLFNGTVITGLDHIIFATGYHYSFPFLPAYHNSSLGPNDEAPRSKEVIQPIITDGTHLRSLHLDLFYIPDPTLAFISMNTGVQVLQHAEYLSITLAKVWSQTAFLPNTKSMWNAYDEKVKERGGYHKYFMFLPVVRAMNLLKHLVAWLNDAAYKFGGKQVDTPNDNNEINRIWFQARFGKIPYSVVLPASSGTSASPKGDQDVDMLTDLAYSDMW